MIPFTKLLIMQILFRHTLATLTVLAATQAYAFELSHSAGQLQLPAPPTKIVCYDLAALDTLNALDIPVVGVPKSSYEGKLSKYNQVTIVGSLFEPSFTTLEKIKPDLIIAGGRSSKALPELNKIAPAVSFDSDRTSFLESFKTTNLAIGRAFGKEAQAKQALAGIQKNLDELHRINQGKTGAFLFAINGNVMAHAPGDRFGYAYELAGLTSVLPAKDSNAPAEPRAAAGSEEAKAQAARRAQVIESIANANPDWLIVLDRGAINGGKKTAADTLAKHPHLSQTQAYKEGRVYYVDPNGWYIVGGGLDNMRSISEQMLSAMKQK